jgi:outer membrane protein OmpA-like peptidoglycan-associated protein
MGNFKNANVSQQTFYIYFEREGSSISDRQAEVLQKAVFDVKNNPEKFLYIEGNCSLQDGAYASETAAHTLALQRANTIADYFIKNGVSSGRIKVTENGNTRPTRELDNDRVDIYMRS